MSTENTYSVDLASANEIEPSIAGSLQAEVMDRLETPNERAICQEILEHVEVRDGKLCIYVDSGWFEWRQNCQEELLAVVKIIGSIVGGWDKNSEFAWQQDDGMDWLGRHEYSLQDNGVDFEMSEVQLGSGGYTFDSIEYMDRGELSDIVDEKGLDIVLDDFESIEDLRQAVIGALKK